MKKFRNPYLVIMLAYSILFVSCTNGDYSTTTDQETILNVNNSSNRTSEELISQNKILWEQVQEKYGYVGFNLTYEELTLNDNDFETNFDKATKTGLISISDKSIFENLGNDIITIGFDNAISKFEFAFEAKGYKDVKLSVYENFVKSLKQKNIEDPSFFARVDCAIAVIGFAAAFISLTGLTAATGGLMVGVTVVGYCAASVSLVRACK